MKNRILLDNFFRFHNYLRISLTERCNLRCTYCMPEKGIVLTEENQLLSTEELQRLIRIFIKNGVTKVRLTGGEPTINKDLIKIVDFISKFGVVDKIAITSNGLVLKRKLNDLKKSGLTHVNISLDTMNEGKFMFLTKRQGVNKVIESIYETESLFGKVKVNCVLIRNFNDDEIIDLVNLSKDRKIDMRFIEFMPFDDNSK